MQDHLLSYEMTDAVISQAVREDCLAVLKEYAKVRDLMLVLASTLVFVLVFRAQAHWIWWLSALPVIIYIILGAGWVGAYFWLPHAARSRMSGLPHRIVRVELADEHLAFETAAERLEVAWGELKALKRRPGFLFMCLESGAQIPVPLAEIPVEAIILLESKLAARYETGDLVP